ncbi:MAG: translation initiation factor IF-2 N-terminal domain-containing protein, partial [Epsilonproteobacteria bacterium]|nr:translation initiation factor IF-2 N-terminal domain-containing protein [Campylobacterota bacterium]
MIDKVSIREIAEESGSTHAEVISKAKDLGIILKSPQSKLNYEMAEEIVNYIVTNKSDLLHKDEKNATRIMKRWFVEMYENPTLILPYDSGTKEYMPIFGTLIEPKTVLEERYNNLFDSKYINEVSNEFSNISQKWTPKPKDESFSKRYVEEIDKISDMYEIINIFNHSISSIETIIKIQIPDKKIQMSMNYMIYSNIFTIIETLLSDIFYFNIRKDTKFQRRFIENYQDFKKETISISSIYETHENIMEKILKKLDTILWHKFELVISLYKNVLGAELELNYFLKNLGIRHDIVHRNGKKQQEHIESLDVAVEDINEAIAEAKKLRDLM